MELVLKAAAARSRADSLSGVMLLGEAGVLTMEQRARYAEVAPNIHTGGGGPNPPPPPRRK
ncbi:MAG: hypothetical protein GY704_14085 [Phycisphaeraceae bacterium]|nr:hypothetical protein [Phycisphaeraceae bacterium]